MSEKTPNACCFIPPWIWQREDLSDKVKMLAGRLIALAEKTGWAYPSNAFICKDMGLKERRVQQLIAEMATPECLGMKIEWRGNTRYLRIPLPDADPQSVAPDPAKHCAHTPQEIAPIVKNREQTEDYPGFPGDGDGPAKRRNPDVADLVRYYCKVCGWPKRQMQTATDTFTAKLAMKRPDGSPMFEPEAVYRFLLNECKPGGLAGEDFPNMPPWALFSKMLAVRKELHGTVHPKRKARRQQEATDGD